MKVKWVVLALVTSLSLGILGWSVLGADTAGDSVKRWWDWDALDDSVERWRDALYLKEEARRTLRGLKGVYVIVNLHSLPQKIEGDGLTRSQIKTDVELRLRKAGVPVLTREEVLKAPGRTGLCVVVTMRREDNIGLYLFCLEVDLIQEVLLARDPTVSTPAATWERNGVGYATAGKISDAVRRSVADYIDEFINGYLAANPPETKK